MPHNLLFLLTDQWIHEDYSYRGRPVPTPHLDLLAGRSTRFTNAFTTCPLCSPARGALLTGQWNWSNGIRDNFGIGYSAQQPLGLTHPTWLDAAVQHGYHTGYHGKWHLGPNGPVDHGLHSHDGPIETNRPPYDPATSQFSYEQTLASERERVAQLERGEPYFWGVKSTPASQTPEFRLADRGRRFLSDWDAAGRSQPFCLTLSWQGPHFPHYLPPDYAARAEALIETMDLPANLHDTFDRKPAHHAQAWWPSMDTSMLDDDGWRRVRAYAALHNTLVDAAIGQVLDELDSRGLTDSTMVIFCADHGDTNGAHNRFDKGAYFYEEVWRIPLLIAEPDVPDADQPAWCSLLDVSETLFRTLGQPAGERPGRDLRPLLGGARADATFPAEVLGVYDRYNGHSFAVRALRDERYKYVWNPQAIDELYDLESDPAELVNRLGDPALAAVEQRLRKRLFERLAELGDDLPGQVDELPAAGTVLVTS